jgi:hypothetical protein
VVLEFWRIWGRDLNKNLSFPQSGERLFEFLVGSYSTFLEFFWLRLDAFPGDKETKESNFRCKPFAFIWIYLHTCEQQMS